MMYVGVVMVLSRCLLCVLSVVVEVPALVSVIFLSVLRVHRKVVWVYFGCGICCQCCCILWQLYIQIQVYWTCF